RPGPGHVRPAGDRLAGPALPGLVPPVQRVRGRGPVAAAVRARPGPRPAADRRLRAGGPVHPPHASADEIEELVTARLARQALLARADPPLLYVLLDEGVLHRPVGMPEVMATQLVRLADLGEQTYVTLQVIPYSAGANIGLQGGFAIADLPDLP